MFAKSRLGTWWRTRWVRHHFPHVYQRERAMSALSRLRGE